MQMARAALAALALAGAFALPAPASAADLIINGSFEAPVVPSGGFTLFASGSSGITGWTVVGAAGGVGIVDGTFVQNGISFVAGDGNQWLDLTGLNTNAVEGVEQSVATVIGNNYLLSFKVGNVNNPGGVFGISSTVDLFVNGASIGSNTLSGGPTGTQNWGTFTFAFTATSATTVVRFLNGDGANDNTNGLDAVSLVETGSSVPEAATWSLMIVAFGLMGFARRRAALS